MRRVKPEMHQSVIEVGTRVCKNIKEARGEIQALRREMITLASENGMRAGGGSTHPFADWKLAGDLSRRALRHASSKTCRLVARANLVFGLHVHIGIEDRNTAIHIMNSDALLPAAHPGAVDQFALLDGHEYRLQIVSLQSLRASFPRTGIPDISQLVASTKTSSSCWSRPTASITARKSGGTSGRIRSFNTLEVRVCDIPMRLDETIAHRRADSGDRGNVVQVACIQQELPHLWARADHGEQVPRLALRDSRASLSILAKKKKFRSTT